MSAGDGRLRRASGHRLVWIVSLAWLAAGSAAGQTFAPDRGAERPAAQAGQHGTVSFMERSYQWPLLGSNSLRFSYVVDSQTGSDFLRVLIDGNLAWSVSGTNRAGTHTLPVPAGTHSVRFEYRKDGSGSAGRDTAIVDDVEFRSSANTTVQRFDTLAPLAATGWTAGGIGGGFALTPAARDRSAARPAAQLQLHSSTSFMERTLTWGALFCPQPPDCPPWNGAVSFDYLVDSESEGDELRVLIDGIVRWSASGRNRAGTQRVRIPGPGPHSVRFEYVKDGAGSAGRDLARIDRVVFVAGDRRIMEYHDFAGREIGVTPIRVAGGPGEWVSGGAAGGWTVHAATPHYSYVPLQTVGAALRPGYLSFIEPAVDGLVGSAEYRNATSAALPNYGHLGADRASLRWVASANTDALYTALIARADTPAGGAERGRLHLFIDNARSTTLDGSGECAGDPRWPAASDRRIRIAYRIAAGDTEAVLTSVTEEQGNCAGGAAAWGTTASPLLLPDATAAVRISKPPQTPGWLHIEARLPLAPAAVADGLVGLGMFRRSIATQPSWERVPSVDGSRPLPDDVLSWETIALSLPESKRSLAAAERVDEVPLIPDPERRRFFYLR